ncbi:MAG: hypothetical protein JNL88_00635 [Bacteroidia bacterium]|nr:hypothetical protein [Bacteroidia bacterium]
MTEKENIKTLVESFLAGTECFLVDVKLSPGKLAVFIDKPSGVTLDECSALTRKLLDHYEDSPFLESHEVEVGSPGMESPLVVPQQYQRRLGRELRVLSNTGQEMKGVLEEVLPDGIALKETVSRKENKKKIISEVLHRIAFADIKEAKLIINYKFK